MKKVPNATRPTVNAARRVVKTAARKAKEIAYQSKPPRSKSAMWKLARYSIGRDYVAGIGTFSTYDALFFYRGRELQDETGLLEGSGEQSGFIGLRTSAGAEQPPVEAI